ncbi:MAG: pre-peptidase C-terminal domain-containing protein [Lachnospiraceae bacterium]|nr:pre-peptidase C-terminal domain-containing protein [Lachnospiraceae bacterium]
MKKIFSFILSLILVLAMIPAGITEAKTTATDVTLNSTVTVKLSNNGDSKMYRFKTTEAGQITIDVATTAQGDNYTITTTLKDEDGKVVVDPQTGSAYSMPSYGASADETFYLIVEPAFRGYDTSFKITFGFSTTQNWETENNDTSEKADTISSDTEYYGSISKSTDVDFYKFRVAGSNKVKLTFGPAVIDGQSRSWDVDLYNEKGESLDCFDTGSKNSITLNLKKGLYYIRVAGQTVATDEGGVTEGVGGDYIISFKRGSLSIKKPKVTEVKMYGEESWLYDNYATAKVSIKNGGAIDGYTMKISRSSNMKSGTKKKNYDLSASNGVTGKKIRSKIRMGIYPAYYVQVRGYVKDAFGGKIYGKYSNIKSGSLSAREYNKLK